MRKVIPFLFVLVLLPSIIFGQGALTVSGKVTDALGEPLIGASVIIKSFNIGAATDLDGKYQFEVPANLVKGQRVELIASYVNYKKKTVTITLTGNNIKQDFILEEDVFQNDEIVVTGIASKTSKSVAEVAVSRVAVSDLTSIQSYQSLNQLLTGKVTGVQVYQSSGNIGAGFRFNVRGGGGLNGNGQPLIYVDGTLIDNTEVVGYGRGGQGFNNMYNLNVNDIENIEILKGPAAAAMYGTNASNGVVLITTKGGKVKVGGAGASQFALDYKYNFGINTPSFKYKAEHYESAKDDRANNIYKDGLIREHNLSLRGGTNLLNYYVSFSTKAEEGILDPITGDKQNLRANITALPSDNITIKVNTTFNWGKVGIAPNDNNLVGYVTNSLLGMWVFQADSNAVAAIKDIIKTNQFLGSVKIGWTPLSNLEINAGAGVDNTDFRQDNTWPSNFSYTGVTKGQKNIFNRNSRLYTFDFNARYNFDITDELKLSSVLGSQIIESRFSTSFLSAMNFGSPLIMQIGAGGQPNGVGEAYTHTRSAGIYFENSFSYDNTYFWTLGIRRDYASTVGREAPSITYPKGSFAVRMDRLFDLPFDIKLLKLRAAYGISGQLPGNNDPIPLLWGASNAGHGVGAVISAIGNAAIEPEKIQELELGLETEFLDMFSLEFTYWNNKAEHSIVQKNESPSTGLTASAVPFNLGGVKSHGFETLLQINPIRSRDYDLNFTLIWNYSTNEITDLGGSTPIFANFNINVVEKGLKRSQFYTYVSTQPKFDPVTNKYTGYVTSPNRVDLGSPFPDHYGSVSVNFRFLRNFTLYANADYGFNNRVANQTLAFAAYYANNTQYNILQAKLGLTTAKPEVPRLIPGTPEYISAANEFVKINPDDDGNYIFDADYLAVREVSLSYDFTELLKDLFPNQYIKSMQVGFSGYNLLRISKYEYGDIETNFGGSSRNIGAGVDFCTLQLPRTYNFWFKLGF